MTDARHLGHAPIEGPAAFLSGLLAGTISVLPPLEAGGALALKSMAIPPAWPSLMGSTADWADLLDEGARDLGGISVNGDSVSPPHAWPAIATLVSSAVCRLAHRR